MTPEQREYLLSLDRDGEITADEVLEAARPPASPIHDLFEWDDLVAGEAHRLDQARDLIRRVKFIYYPPERTVREIRGIEYTRTPLIPHNQQGYMRVGIIAQNPEYAADTLKTELQRVRSMVRRARDMATRLNMEAECEAGLREILGPQIVTSPPRGRGRQKVRTG